MSATMTHDEFLATARERFGDDAKMWAFLCPNCGDRATVQESGDGYNLSADALWKAALLAFNYAAREVGASGFQAEWAALRFYSEALHIDGPFGIVRAENALYPQYDEVAKIRGWIDVEWREWIAEQASTKLAEYDANPTTTWTDDDGVEQTTYRVAPRVVAHWRALIAGVSA